MSVIDAASLNDEEFELIEQTTLEFTVALYNQMMLVLDSRETVSGTRDRLTYYFRARGIEVTEPSPGQSNIFIGAGLCS